MTAVEILAIRSSLTIIVWRASNMLIAEVGCNHKGDFAIAKEMIMMAAQFCRADVVKFQKRTNKKLLSDAEYNAPHPNPAFSYGNVWGAP